MNRHTLRMGTTRLLRALRFAGPGLALALGLSACVVRPARVTYTYSGSTTTGVDGEIYVRSAPPPPIAEFRTPPPGPGYVWVDGYWDWTGYDWSWISGYWVAARPNYLWVGPRYVVVSGRWVYQPGYWRGAGGYRDYHYGRPSTRAPAASGWRAPPSGSQGSASGGWRAPPSGNQGGNPGGGWRAPPASNPGASPPPADGGGWRAPPTSAAPPPAAGGGWRGGPSPSAPAPAPAPGGSTPGGWRGTPTPAPAPAPAPGGGWRAPATGSPPQAGRGAAVVPSPPPATYRPMPSAQPRQVPYPSPSVGRGPSRAVPGPGRSSPQPVESRGGVMRGRTRAAPR